MIRRLLERVLLGPEPRVGHQSYDPDAEEDPAAIWRAVERELARQQDPPTEPIPVDVGELEARNTDLEVRVRDLVGEVTQLRKTNLDLQIERDTLLADNRRLRADTRLRGISVDRADQLAEENRRLEREVNRLRRSRPATRDELVRARETAAGLEERLARAEGRAHGRPYDRSGRRT